jgi:hypothetical protein
MIGPSLTQLGAIGQVPSGSFAESSLPDTRLGREVREFLTRFNGLLAYESALWVRSSTDRPRGLDDWNDPTGWRSEYGDMATDLWFFAEDAFGTQFALLEDSIVSFDPETGQQHSVASSLEDWADQILSDPDVVTGYPLAHEWQVRHRPLGLGERLIPRVPFVLGGDFSVDNLFAMRAERGMSLRGNLATQIRDLPDGTAVRYSFDEP